MGSNQAKFEEETMNEFEATTSLNRAEIYHAFTRFQAIYDEHQQDTSSEIHTPLLTTDGYINPDVTLPVELILEKLPELMNEMMSFVEFLDMVSAFNPKNDLQQRTFHAFQIFDIDQDGLISREDLYEVLATVTDSTISDACKARIVDELFSEVHKERSSDGLSTEDFRYAISKSPDFPATFSFRI